MPFSRSCHPNPRAYTISPSRAKATLTAGTCSACITWATKASNRSHDDCCDGGVRLCIGLYHLRPGSQISLGEVQHDRGDHLDALHEILHADVLVGRVGVGCEVTHTHRHRGGAEAVADLVHGPGARRAGLDVGRVPIHLFRHFHHRTDDGGVWPGARRMFHAPLDDLNVVVAVLPQWLLALCHGLVRILPAHQAT